MACRWNQGVLRASIQLRTPALFERRGFLRLKRGGLFSMRLLRLLEMSVISVACMPNREGSECHRDDKRKSAIQKAYFNGLRPAVFRAGLQKDHGLGDCPQGGGLQQLVPEYFPRQRRRTDRAGGVHVRKSVCHGAQHESCCRCVSTRSRRQSR